MRAAPAENTTEDAGAAAEDAASNSTTATNSTKAPKMKKIKVPQQVRDSVNLADIRIVWSCKPVRVQTGKQAAGGCRCCGLAWSIWMSRQSSLVL